MLASNVPAERRSTEPVDSARPSEFIDNPGAITTTSMVQGTTANEIWTKILNT